MACDFDLVLSNTDYLNKASDPFEILDLVIIDSCLHATIAASGCDGSSWEVEMFDSEEIAESFPVQRFLRIVLDDDEECEAVIQMEYSFNLNNIKVGEEDMILLNVDDWTPKLKFEY